MSAINSWFSSVSYLPAWGGNLCRFLGSSIGLCANLIFSKKMPNIVWADIDSAYADRPNNRIVISSRMLSEEAPKRYNKRASKEEAMAAVMGTLVHEAAHFVYSPDNLLGFLNKGVPANKLSLIISNLVEDKYIERAIVERERGFDWMIKATWNYFFTEEEIEKRLAAWNGEDKDDIGKIINVMITWKVDTYFQYFAMRSEFEKTLYGMLCSVHTMHDLQERKDLIEKIYRFLLSETKGRKGDSEEGEGNSEEGEGDSMESGDSDLLKKIDSDSKTQTSGAYIPTARMHPLESVPVHKGVKEIGVAGKMPVVWLEVGSGSGKLSYDRKWLEFKRWAADMGTLRSVRGSAGNFGKLTHPARFVDDGKIFSKRYISSPSGRTGETGSPQTIILVDLSGSMNGRMGERENGERKVNAALSAAQGALDGLIAAGHRVAIYGHSTVSIGMDSENCALYVVKSFSDTEGAAALRLSALKEGGALLNNGDSFAVEAVVGKFMFDDSPMRLFVISDGEPACNMYRYVDGVAETKKAVDAARRKGVEVFSFSIDSEAIESNNKIYGANNNFDAQEIDVVRRVLRKFV